MNRQSNKNKNKKCSLSIERNDESFFLSSPITAWKCNFTDFLTCYDRPTNQKTDMRVHMKVTLPTSRVHISIGT